MLPQFGKRIERWVGRDGKFTRIRRKLSEHPRRRRSSMRVTDYMKSGARKWTKYIRTWIASDSQIDTAVVYGQTRVDRSPMHGSSTTTAGAASWRASINVYDNSKDYLHPSSANTMWSHAWRVKWRGWPVAAAVGDLPHYVDGVYDHHVEWLTNSKVQLSTIIDFCETILTNK